MEDFEKLNIIIQQINNHFKTRDIYMRHYCELLTLTGCRKQEPIISDIWSLVNDRSIMLKPQKNNNNRYFDLKIFPDWFLSEFLNNPNYFNLLYPSTINYQIILGSGPFQAKHGTKLLSANLFRHYYAKKLHFEGLSDYDIKIELGEKDIKNAQNYIYSKLTFNF